MRSATVYTLDGQQSQLPYLNPGRYYHACGHYINSEDKKVNTSMHICIGNHHHNVNIHMFRFFL